jgi:hypothetical protein
MEAKFEALVDCEVEIIENFNEDMETVESTVDIFSKGDIIEGELITDLETSFETQFGDGTVAYLDKEHFKLLSY